MPILYFFHYQKYKKACSEVVPALMADEEIKSRILFVAPYMSMGGAEKVVLDLAKCFDRKKYVVDIAVITDNPDGLHLWCNLYADVADNLWHFPSIIHRAYRAYFLRYIVKSRKYDCVIMSHAIVYIDSLIPVLARFPACKRYCIIHDVYPGWSYDVAHYDFFWNSYICVCEFACKMLAELKGVLPAKITVIHNGVDIQQFDPKRFFKTTYREKLNIQASDKVVAFISRMDSAKNPECVIEVAKLMREFQDVRFFMAGNGPVQEEIERMIQLEDLQATVFLLGAIDDVPQLLSEIDLLFHCAKYEAFGLCILEAMAMGKPAVVPRTGGIPEFFADGINGVILEHDENFVQNSKNAILRLLNEPNNKYMEINRAKAESLSLERQFAQYEKLILK
ncbi:MAG: glycosyltransferase family 4 protein [Candidatus Methylumidiphilus sp.]